MVDIDVSDLTRLAVDLADARGRMEVGGKAVVFKAAMNIKKSWRESARGLPHAPAYPYSITFDAVGRGGDLLTEIGPDKGKAQGALGNLIEYGSVNNPPHGDGAAAAAQEEPAFREYMAAAAKKAVLG